MKQIDLVIKEHQNHMKSMKMKTFEAFTQEINDIKALEPKFEGMEIVVDEDEGEFTSVQHVSDITFWIEGKPYSPGDEISLDKEVLEALEELELGISLIGEFLDVGSHKF